MKTKFHPKVVLEDTEGMLIIETDGGRTFHVDETADGRLHISTPKDLNLTISTAAKGVVVIGIED